jgi:hypothetical protein
MAAKDIAIPLVFPDYLIMVETPPVSVEVPDLLPFVDILPDKIKMERTKQKLPYLGHAGILFIQGSNGLSKYYEYGRYDPAAKGLVRKLSISDVKMKNGQPTNVSLVQTLSEISAKSGQNGRITGAYIELDPGAFVKMLAYAAGRLKQNSDPKRAPYELLWNSCLHFMKLTAEAGGATMPTVIAPQPAGYIVQVRLQHNDLDYDPSRKVTIENVTLN